MTPDEQLDKMQRDSMVEAWPEASDEKIDEALAIGKAVSMQTRATGKADWEAVDEATKAARKVLES